MTDVEDGRPELNNYIELISRLKLQLGILHQKLDKSKDSLLLGSVKYRSITVYSRSEKYVNDNYG